MGGVEEVMGLNYAFVLIREEWIHVDVVRGGVVQEKTEVGRGSDEETGKQCMKIMYPFNVVV